VNEALTGAVHRFIDELTPVVEALGSGVPAVRADRLAGDVALEVFDLACALVDADGLHTDNELWALIATFGPLLESQLGHADPAALRRAGLVTGRRRWVEGPSPLFELVLAADRRNDTSTSWTYYARAMAVAHEVAAIDAHVARLELVALETLRSTLLRSISSTGSPVRHAPGRSARGGVPTAGRATTHEGSASVAVLPLPRSRRRARSRSCTPSSTPSSASTS
jgi:hypothetical protein